MPEKRKTLAMTVTVSVPAEMTAAQARKEVRSLIGDQCNYAADYEDVRVRSVKAARKS